MDESGDPGVSDKSSERFILTSVYMPSDLWQANFDVCRNMRTKLKEDFGFPMHVEMHTKHFLTDKNPYRDFQWTREQKREILNIFIQAVADMTMKSVNVIIERNGRYAETALETAVTFSIQRVENDSLENNWFYTLVSDNGCVGTMRKIARKIRIVNMVPSRYPPGYYNAPVKRLVEDVFEKDSRDSYFIQVADFISYYVNLYVKSVERQEPLPGRVSSIISQEDVRNAFDIWKERNRLNLKSNKHSEYGFVHH